MSVTLTQPQGSSPKPAAEAKAGVPTPAEAKAAKAKRLISAQVRRDILIFTGFIAAGFILSVNLDVVGLLYRLGTQHGELQLSKLFGTIIFACVGLTLYVITRYSDHIRELRTRLHTEERARRVAMHDPLTGLPNRRHLKGVLNWLLSNNDSARKLGVVMLDVDRFGSFNDANDRAMGDEVLMNIGKVLNMRAGVSGFVARLEMDEFVILLPDQGEEELMDWLSATLTAIEVPMMIGKTSVSVSATAGAAIGLADGRDAETLLHRASLALRRAKDTSRGWFAFFKTGMDELVRQRALFENDLWNAVRNDEIAPYYQPLVSLVDGKPYGYEVLARWTHATRGPIPPDQFIPTAEASGAISELTINLLRKACREAVNVEGAPRLSLNLSPVLLGDEGLAKQLLKVLEESNFAPQRLEVELTEAALVTDLDAAREILHTLRQQGVTVALDNFGKGHASLLQLRQLPFDKLKIDRSFVRRMVNDKESATLVRTIIAMAKSLGLTVVAEGVETVEQGKALMAMGCDMGQGYLYGRASQTIAVRPGEPRTRRVATPKPVAEFAQLAD
jgi:diguanylate cyclase (GGDEF)-like protein